MEDFLITAVMLEYGGDFVKRLAMLHRVADPENREKIKAAWPEYWEKYRAMAETKEKSRCDTSASAPE